ncbi:MAG TPA: A/G-specific adenine glycosylase [Acidobacteriota bacterium]|nr:A/G-specific adenine glycosylase [Acidobacteriota bacterium]
MSLQRSWDISRVRKFRQLLLRWYHQHRRPFPWRENPTPYRIWISEIMLQQTQAKAVIPRYGRFLDRFPNLESLAQASEHDVLELWSGLGYYSRARNLHRAARLIVKEYGDFPGDFSAILALPGVGRYTAGAVCSIAFNQALPVVDGNVRRVITRLEGLRKKVPDGFFWDRMSAWISQKQPSSFNQAMMELGATVCTPLHPLCPSCPAEALCEGRKLGIQDRIPIARAKRATQRIPVAILIVEKQRRVLLTSRQKLSIIPGKWGFPCTRVLQGKSAEEAVNALCIKLFGRTLPSSPCARISHSITHHRITAYGFFCNADLRIPRMRGAQGIRWATFQECGRLLTSSLFHKALMECHTANSRK